MAEHDRTIRTTEPDRIRTVEGARAVGPGRTADERLADHDRIGRLAEELLPELASRLAAGNLGEIEIREDGWRLRVRRPAGAAVSSTRRAAERARSGAGHATQPGHSTQPGHATQSGHAAAAPGGSSGAAAETPLGSIARDPHRIVATSPAVGIFYVRPELHAGSRVQSGERIATVDLLGVPQDVVSPEDGVVVEILADNGDGVEYGQDLVVIELVGRFGPVRAVGSAHEAGDGPGAHDGLDGAADSNGSVPIAPERA